MNARIDVLGVHVSAINLDMTIETFERWIDKGDRHYVCITGVHGVMESQSDPDLKRIHNASGLTTPDGMPLVWCGRFAGADWMSRVYGPDLILRVMEHSGERGWSHFFYGAAPGVADQLAESMRSSFPDLQIAGTHSPPYRSLSDSEIEETAVMLNESEADIIWVGLSTPKQERWMHQFRPLLDAPVIVGVGAAFDIHAGRLRQAPPWMQRSGLEWAFRLAMEPRRLWRRYLKNNPRFVARILLNRPRMVEDAADTPAR